MGSAEESEEVVLDVFAQVWRIDIDLFEVSIIRERRHQVMIAMKGLPPEQTQVIDLAYFQGMSQREIAVQTGLALGAVKTRIRLGLSKLRSALDSKV